MRNNNRFIPKRFDKYPVTLFAMKNLWCLDTQTAWKNTSQCLDNFAITVFWYRFCGKSSFS